MSIVLDSNGFNGLANSPVGLSLSKLSLNSLSNYPSTINIASNEIYLNTVSSLNNVLFNVEKMSQLAFDGSRSPQVLTLEIENLEKDTYSSNTISKIKFNENIDHQTSSTETVVHKSTHVNNRIIRSLLRFIRPTLAKKRINKKIHTKVTDLALKKKAKKNSIGRSKFRKNRSGTIGILNNPVRKKSGLDNNEESSFSSSNETSSQKKGNRAKRALSLITKSNKFSTSASISSMSCSSPTNFNNSSNVSQADLNQNVSKEINWYRLEELDYYYKILEHVMEETSANIFNVIEILQEKFLILSGGCTKIGSLIFTFTDNCNENEIKPDKYRKAIDYFCNIPSEQDKDKGFSILIDRRNDKWSSVKNVLILIQEYFPAKLNSIYILRPQSYFQRVFSTIFFQEDSFVNNHSVSNTIPEENTPDNILPSSSKSTSLSIYNNQTNYSGSHKSYHTRQNLNIKIFKSVDQLYEFIDQNQLTTEFGGSIHYRHQEWIEQRQFIEKLSSNVNDCVASLKLFIKSMEETDFPNDVTSTEQLIHSQIKEKAQILDTVVSTRRFGETVLDVIERTSHIDMFKNSNEKYTALTPDIRIHYQTVFNLLKLMEESEKTLNMFWDNHYIRLNKCLDLRKFEQSFKNVRINLLGIFDKLDEISDENLHKVEEYESCIKRLQNLNEKSQKTFNEALNLHNQGIQLLRLSSTITNDTDSTTTKTSTNYGHQANLKSETDNEFDYQTSDLLKIDLPYSSLAPSTTNSILSSSSSCDDVMNTSLNNSTSINKHNNNNRDLMEKVNLNCDDYDADETFGSSAYSPIQHEIICTNPTGYCVDSVEPKCNEIKRLIHEFKTNYLIKLNMIKHNRLLMHKLTIIEDIYADGVNLLNSQSMLNVTPEKARTMINEIDDWLDHIEKLELTNFQHHEQSNNLAHSLSFLTIDHSSYNIDSRIMRNKEDVICSLELKRDNLLRSIENTIKKLKMLRDSFTKRQHNLLKACHKPITKPVQRVEPLVDMVDSTRISSSRKSVQRTGSIKANSLNMHTYQPHHHQHVNSSSSSISDDIELEEKKRLEEKKLKHILNELIETERVYVNELKLIIEGYLMKFSSDYFSQIPPVVFNNKEILFGNVQEIYQFHNQFFLDHMEPVQNSIIEISKLFIKFKPYFYLYSTYCLNKPHSEEMWREYCVNNQFFKTIQQDLGMKLSLDTYLLKPVQRISKYQLLLKELQKCCKPIDKPFVDQALESMIDVVKNLNDVMHASYIVGYSELKTMGRLLKRDQFQLNKIKRNNRSSAMNMVNRLKLTETNKPIELFLFEKAVIFCKKKTELDQLSLNSQSNLSSIQSNSLQSIQTGNNIQPSLTMSTPCIVPNTTSSQFQCFYQFKEVLKVDEIGITENLKNEKKKFELWSETSSYILEASNEQIKQAWVSLIKNLLESQLNEIKFRYQTMKQEKFINKRLANPARYTSSISSTSTSSSSTMSSLSSNRTHSLDHYGIDTDDLIDHRGHNKVNRVVSIHNHHINRDQRILNDLPVTSNPKSTLTYSNKSSSAITLDNYEKIMSF